MQDFMSPFASPGIRLVETRLEIRGSTPNIRAIKLPRDAATLLHELIGLADREHFVSLYLNSRHVVTHVHVVSRGTVQTAQVHPREVFKGAILANAVAIIVGHNHPSGDVHPSVEDKALTERLREAGKLLGIEVLDSVIVGPCDSFYTASQEGVFPISYGNALEVADGS